MPPKFSALNSKFASVFKAPSHDGTNSTAHLVDVSRNASISNDIAGVALDDSMSVDIPASDLFCDPALDHSVASVSSSHVMSLDELNSGSDALMQLSRPSQPAALSSSFRNSSIAFSSGSNISVGRRRVLSGKDSEFFVDPIDHSSDPLSLEGLGLPPSCLQNYHSMGIQQLRPWQRECLDVPGVMEGRNLVYCTPTSSGKSLVAEIVSILRVKKLSKIALFVVPYVSLAEEKYSHFHKILQNSGVAVEGFFGDMGNVQNGEMILPAGRNGVIVVCIIEKAIRLILQLAAQNALRNLALVVVDELHQLGDKLRGERVELLLTQLVYLNRSIQATRCPKLTDSAIQIVALSATLPSHSRITTWLDAARYSSESRPIELQHFLKCGSLIYNSSFEVVNSATIANTDLDHIKIIISTALAANQNVLVFCPTKDSARNLALQVSQSMSTDVNDEILESRLVLLKRIHDESSAAESDALRTCIKVGCAFHHSGVSIAGRKHLEEAFKRGVLHVMFCTSTLSVGVNLPASVVIVRSAMVGIEQLTPNAFKQMAGRAGRSGMASEGKVYLFDESGNLAKAKATANRLWGSNTELDIPSIFNSAVGDGNYSAEIVRKIANHVLKLINSTMVSSAAEVSSLLASSWFAQTASLDINCFNRLTEQVLQYLRGSDFQQQYSLFLDHSDGKLTCSRFGNACSEAELAVEDAKELLVRILRHDSLGWTSQELLLLLCGPLTEDVKRRLSKTDISAVLKILNVHDDETLVMELQVGNGYSNAVGANVQIKRLQHVYSTLLQQIAHGESAAMIGHKTGIDVSLIQDLNKDFKIHAATVLRFMQTMRLVDLASFCSAEFNGLFSVANSVALRPLLRIMNQRLANCFSQSGFQTLDSIAAISRESVRDVVSRSFPFLPIADSRFQAQQKDIDAWTNSIVNCVCASSNIVLGKRKATLNETKSSAPLIRPANSVSVCRPALAQAPRLGEPVVINVMPQFSSSLQDFFTVWSTQTSFAFSISCRDVSSDDVLGSDSIFSADVEREKRICSLTTSDMSHFSVAWGNSVFVIRFPRIDLLDHPNSDIIDLIELSWTQIRHVFASTMSTKILFNAKGLLQVLNLMQVHVGGMVYDPVIALFSIDPDVYKVSQDSKTCLLLLDRCIQICLTQFDAHVWIPKFCVEHLESSSEAQQCSARAQKSWFLMQALLHILESRNLMRLFVDECKLIPILSRIEYHGIGVDRTYFRQFRVELEHRIKYLEMHCAFMLGHDINLNSPAEVATVVYDELKLPKPPSALRSPSGRAVSKDELVWFCNQPDQEPHPFIVVLAEHRDLSHLLHHWVARLCSDKVVRNTGLDGRPGVPVPVHAQSNFRIHCNFSQTAAATGRLSCHAPNLQSVPASPIEFLPAPRRSLHQELSEEPESILNLLQSGSSLAASAADRQQRICFVAFASLNRSCRVGELVAVSERSCNEPFSDHSSQSLAEYWRGRGFDFSEEDALACKQVKIRFPNSTLSEALTFPAQFVWRLDAFVLDSSNPLLDTSFGSNESALSRFQQPLQLNPRDAFVPAPGYLLLSADFSQMELRLISHFSGESEMQGVLKSGGDMIRAFASKWMKIPDMEVTDEQRDSAKKIMYSLLYGQGSTSLAQELCIDQAAARAMKRDFFACFPAIAKYFEVESVDNKATGSVTSLNGRVRTLPNVNHLENRERYRALRQLRNFSIQASAADICKKAMIQLDAALQKFDAEVKNEVQPQSIGQSSVGSSESLDESLSWSEGSVDPATTEPYLPAARMVLQIHDEVLIEVREDLVDRISPVVRDAMTSISFDKCPNVPLSLAFSVGNSWGAMQRVAVDYV